MNKDLVMILRLIKQRTFYNTHICGDVGNSYNRCKGVSCRNCLFNSASETSDCYTSRLLFRISI